MHDDAIDLQDVRVRGPEQSRPPEHIAAEVRQLAAEGCKEVTLLGQTVNSYKYQTGDGRHYRMSDLLATIHDTPGLERIKFITNFPKDMTDDLLDAVRTLPKVCPYLHVPAQSGCNDVLKRMKRLYTVEYYKEMLARCRQKLPGVAISSDFIVGFCGETEEAFERTMERLSSPIIVWSYSSDGQVPPDDLANSLAIFGRVDIHTKEHGYKEIVPPFMAIGGRV